MNRASWVSLLFAVLVGMGSLGYLVIRPDSETPSSGRRDQAVTSVEQPYGPTIYYRNPDNEPSYSLLPKQTADGRAYRPVLASEDISFDEGADMVDPEDQPEESRVLYYRNPMGLPDISPTPKKDSMGMDYIPVYEEENIGSPSVRISPGRIQEIGVRSEITQMRVISEVVRGPGTIQLDERHIAVITLRAEAFVDRVEDVTTGSEVSKDQPLIRIYSPAISAAASEYISVLRTGGNTPNLKGSRQKLLNLAVPPDYISELERTREVPQTFTWLSPRNGLVLERNVVEGMQIMPGDVLFRIADHSTVWALVDVAERDLSTLAINQAAVLHVRSYPDRSFSGTVDLIYPHLNPSTRTVTVRIELSNSDFLLRPDMYVEAEIDTGSELPVLAVPDNAVIDSGKRQFVILDIGDGRFEPRPVGLGRRGGGYIEIREGITTGDRVVVAANFLIDSESNLKSALSGLDSAASQ